jgi:thiol-disulfide isomerase/thioredoxin
MRRFAWVYVLLLLAGLVTYAVRSDDEPDKAPMLFPADNQPVDTSVDLDTPELRALKERAGIEDCAPGPGGGALPAVTVACLGGGPAVDLSSLRGPMIINLWQVACQACEIEMPILQAFHEQYGDRVAVLGIDSADIRPGSAIELLDERGVTFPQLADPDGALQDTPVFATVLGYPQLFFLSEDGEIAYQKAGAVESAEELESLVEEHLGVSL